MAITTATQAAQIVNESMKTLGYEYQIDVTNGDTIEEGFKQIGVFNPSALRRILDQVVTILVFRNYGVMFDESDNPTRVFWRDFINYGGGEEDIFHEIIEAERGYWAEDFAGLDAEGSKNLALEIAQDLVEYKKSNVRKSFHTDYDNFRIKLSRSDLEISEIFTPNGFAKFVDVQMANIQWSAEVKLQQIAIDQTVKLVNDQNLVFIEGLNPNSTNGVTDIVERIRTTSSGMMNISTAFNKDGVINKSSFDDLFLVTTPEFINRISVRGYANAYNLAEYRDNNRLLELPYGTDLGTSPTGQKVLAVLVDRRAIVLALRYWNMMPNRVENTDYINYFLKVRFIKGYNTFFNAVAFCGDDIGFFVNGGEMSVISSTAQQTVFVNGVSTVISANGAIAVPRGSVVEGDGLVFYGGFNTDRSQMVAQTDEIEVALPIYVVEGGEGIV